MAHDGFLLLRALGSAHLTLVVLVVFPALLIASLFGIRFALAPSLLSLLGQALIPAKAAAGAILFLSAVVMWAMARTLPSLAAERLLSQQTRAALALLSARRVHSWAGVGLGLAALLHALCHLLGTLPRLAAASSAEVRAALGDDNAAKLVPSHGRGRVPSLGALATLTLPGATGLLMLLCLAVLALGAMPVVRRRYFEAFYLSHHLGVTYSVVLLAHGALGLLQTPLAPLWVGPPLLVYLLDRLFRAWQFRQPLAATVLLEADHGAHHVVLLEVHAPATGGYRARLLRAWRPGQYSLVKWHAHSWLQQHPYMVISHAGDHAAGRMRLAVAGAGSWSRHLVHVAQEVDWLVLDSGTTGAPPWMGEGEAGEAGDGVPPMAGNVTCDDDDDIEATTASLLPPKRRGSEMSARLWLRIAGPMGMGTLALAQTYSRLHIVVHRASPAAAFVPLVAQLATDNPDRHRLALERIDFYVLDSDTPGMAWLIATVRMLLDLYDFGTAGDVGATQLAVGSDGAQAEAETSASTRSAVVRLRCFTADATPTADSADAMCALQTQRSAKVGPETEDEGALSELHGSDSLGGMPRDGLGGDEAWACLLRGELEQTSCVCDDDARGAPSSGATAVLLSGVSPSLHRRLRTAVQMEADIFETSA